MLIIQKKSLKHFKLYKYAFIIRVQCKKKQGNIY